MSTRSSRRGPFRSLEEKLQILEDYEVAQITALGRPDGRVLDLDPATHEEF